MIPVVIVIGLVLGRWWRTALVGGVGYWAVVLTTMEARWGLVLAGSALALINAAFGVLVHQALLRVVRSNNSHASSSGH